MSEFETLRVKVVSLEYMKNPYWIKEYVDGFFIMRYVNLAYETEYLKPHKLNRENYINNPDWIIWGHDLAKKYYNNDMKCFLSKSEHKFIETIKTPTDNKKMMFIKRYYKDELTNKEYIIGFRFYLVNHPEIITKL